MSQNIHIDFGLITYIRIQERVRVFLDTFYKCLWHFRFGFKSTPKSL